VNFASATVLALFVVAALTAQKTFPEILKTKLIFQFILKLWLRNEGNIEATESNEFFVTVIQRKTNATVKTFQIAHK